MSTSGPGREPDYRFTLANERTFLAWLRTALALLAGGVAVTHLLPGIGPVALRYCLGLGLVAAALLVAVSGYRYWRRVDDAIRHDRPLPGQRMPLALTIVVATAAVVVVAMGFLA